MHFWFLDVRLEDNYTSKLCDDNKIQQDIQILIGHQLCSKCASDAQFTLLELQGLQRYLIQADLPITSLDSRHVYNEQVFCENRNFYYVMFNDTWLIIRGLHDSFSIRYDYDYTKENGCLIIKNLLDEDASTDSINKTIDKIVTRYIGKYRKIAESKYLKIF